MTTSPLDDHRGLAIHTARLIIVMALAVAVVLLALRRVDALAGLAAGTSVGLADVYLLSRSLTRFGGGASVNPRALAGGMLTRFLAIGVLLGLVLCVRSLDPLAALVGFLLMPASIAITGARFNRLRTAEATDAGR